MSYETIQVEMRDAVGVITLNRPASLNALTTEVGQEFQAAVAEVQRTGARAIVLTGAGRAFCAGGDLREMQKIAEREGKVEAFFDEPLRMLNECILLIRRAPVAIYCRGQRRGFRRWLQSRAGVRSRRRRVKARDSTRRSSK